MTTLETDAGILIKRVFAAPPEKVWRLWTSGPGLEQWRGPSMHDAMWTRNAEAGWTQQVDRLVEQLPRPARPA